MGAHRVRESGGLGVVKVGVKSRTRDLEGILVVKEDMLRDWNSAGFILIGFSQRSFHSRAFHLAMAMAVAVASMFCERETNFALAGFYF